LVSDIPARDRKPLTFFYSAPSDSASWEGSEAKSKGPDYGDKVDSGIELPMVIVLESTLEWT
jgi:hypothetical protein